MQKRNWQGSVMLPGMVNNIAAHAPRNALILHQIAYYLREPDRQFMVMSDRIAHLEALHRDFEAMDVQIERGGRLRRATSGLYIGKMKQVQLDVSATKDVIFASSGICREGLDIASLNSMVLATPVGDVVQAAGRIMRKAHDLCPLILDIVDAFSVFHGQARKRSKYYAASKFQVFTVPYRERETALPELEHPMHEMTGAEQEEPEEPEEPEAVGGQRAAPGPTDFLSDSSDGSGD